MKFSFITDFHATSIDVGQWVRYGWMKNYPASGRQWRQYPVMTCDRARHRSGCGDNLDGDDNHDPGSDGMDIWRDQAADVPVVIFPLRYTRGDAE